MKRLYQSLLLVAMTLTLAVAAGTAMAQSPEPGATLAGHIYFDYGSGLIRNAPPTGALAVGDVYDNTASAANFGFSSTDLLSVWGDEETTIGTGTLNSLDFTVYNSGSSAGPLATASFTLSLFDGPSSTFLGGFNTNPVSLALPAGSYTIISVTGLGGLGITVPTDVIVTQTVLTHTGTANRLGIASLNPPTVGSSVTPMYISSTTVGAAGWYTVSSLPSNPGYRINVSASTPTQKTTWGQLKTLYR